MYTEPHYVLGVDLDNVTANYTKGLRDYMMSRGYSATDMPEPTRYSFVEAGWPFSDTSDYLNHHIDFVTAGGFLSLEEMPGASETIRALVHEGVRIRIITHRLLRNQTYAQSISDTARWLDNPRHKIQFHDFCAISEKSAVGVNMLIDDAPSNIEAVRKSGGNVLIFDQLYNRHLDAPRAHNWGEVFDAVMTDKKRLGL